jgi:hypothetical protein
MSRHEGPHQRPPHAGSMRRGRRVLFACVLATCAALAAGAHARLTSRGEAASTSGMSSSILPGAKGVAATVPGATQEDELTIELSTAGFAPAEVAHAAGAFAIAVDNRDVTDEYVLQLKAESGTLLNEIRVQKGSASWAVELAAGRYTLMVANHPDWVCLITIQ